MILRQIQSGQINEVRDDAPEGWEPPAGWEIVTGSVVPTPPELVPMSVPDVVPLWAFRDVLIRMGVMPAIDAIIQAMDEPDRSLTRNEFECRDPIPRNNPKIDAVAAALGKTPEDVDEVFRKASTLS